VAFIVVQIGPVAVIDAVIHDTLANDKGTRLGFSRAMPETRLSANTAELRDWLREHRGLELADYEALRRWSVAHVCDFWQALWDHFGLQSPTPHRQALSDAHMPGARWFEGAQLNYVAQLRRHVEAGERAGVPALVFRNERLQREAAASRSAGPRSPTSRLRSRRHCAASACNAAIAWQPTCPTSRKRSSVSLPAPRSARSGA
jgi:hypothetical protein